MWYLSLPYTHPNGAVMHARYEVAQEACAILALEGINVYSPICAWHEISNKYNLPTNAAYWRKMNFDAINRSDGMYLLCLPGWEESEGVTMERGWAEGKPNFHIHYMLPGNLESYKKRRMTLEV